MPKIAIQGFDGLVPRMSATMLADSQAQTATNVKLYSRELRFWRGSTLQAATVVASCQSIYKFYASASNIYWLTWGNVGVSVLPAPVTDTTDYRLYYTGDGAPKKTNETLASTGSGPMPRAWRYMGVPAPVAAPTVAPSGGAGTPESRAYVYTYISTFGAVSEESAPSPPSAIISAPLGATVTVNAFSAAPTTGYNITAIRIYRTVSGQQTDSYQFVAQIAIATTTYADSLTAAQLGAVITTIGWDTPSANLAGMIPLPSGAFAAFDGNTVYFSEPFFPHAWPAKYALNIPAPIVGLAAFGTSIAVMTTRYPYIIHGVVPGSMSTERVPSLEPCVSARSIITAQFGVLYASPNGLMQIGSYQTAIQTNALFRRDEWQAITPDFINAVSYDNKYFAFYPITATNVSSFILSQDDVPALSKLEIRASAVHADGRQARLYYLNPVDNSIYQMDSDDLNPMTYTWKSKRFALPLGTTFSALKLDGDFGQVSLATAYNASIAAVIAANQALFANPLKGAVDAAALNVYDLNGSILGNSPPTAGARQAQVLIYGDGTLKATLLVSNWNPVRIPPFRSRDIEVQINGNISVRSVSLATSVTELHT